MKYEDIRRQVLTAIRQASAQGLIHGTSGNISVRDREAGVAAITPQRAAPMTLWSRETSPLSPWTGSGWMGPTRLL